MCSRIQLVAQCCAPELRYSQVHSSASFMSTVVDLGTRKCELRMHRLAAEGTVVSSMLLAAQKIECKYAYLNMFNTRN